MPNKELERRHLGQAEQHITDAEVRITEQMIRIQRLRESGHRTEEAETFLRKLEHALQAFRDHRELILEALGHAD